MRSAARGGLDPAAGSLPAFFALVLALSAPFWLIGWLTDVELGPGLPVSALMAVCPLLAALILAHRLAGEGGVADFVRRAIDLPRGRQWIWLVPAVLLFPVLLTLSSAIEPAPSVSATAAIGAFPMAVAFLVAAIAEELGWSAYATGPAQMRLGVLGAGLVIGGVWAAWHVVPYLQAGRGWNWIAWQAVFSIAARVILVWLYNNAGRSLLIAVLAHASINVAVFLIPTAGAPYDPRAAALAAGLAAFAAAVAWGLRTRASP